METGFPLCPRTERGNVGRGSLHTFKWTSNTLRRKKLLKLFVEHTHQVPEIVIEYWTAWVRDYSHHVLYDAFDN